MQLGQRTHTLHGCAPGSIAQGNECLRGCVGMSLVNAAGFEVESATIEASLDTTGGGLSVLRNMRRYIGVFNTLRPEEADELIEAAEQAVGDGSYLFALPQFVVTANKPT